MSLRSLLERVLWWFSRPEDPVRVRAANDAPPPPAPPGTWCLVGNVIDVHAFGEAKEMRRGSKHFRAGAKVYVLPAQWGDGFEKVIAIGLARKSRRWVTVVMPSALITNWRAKAVYEPAVLERMTRGFQGFAGQWQGRGEVEEFATQMRRR